MGEILVPFTEMRMTEGSIRLGRFGKCSDFIKLETPPRELRKHWHIRV